MTENTESTCRLVVENFQSSDHMLVDKLKKAKPICEKCLDKEDCYVYREGNLLIKFGYKGTEWPSEAIG